MWRQYTQACRCIHRSRGRKFCCLQQQLTTHYIQPTLELYKQQILLYTELFIPNTYHDLSLDILLYSQNRSILVGTALHNGLPANPSDTDTCRISGHTKRCSRSYISGYSQDPTYHAHTDCHILHLPTWHIVYSYKINQNMKHLYVNLYINSMCEIATRKQIFLKTNVDVSNKISIKIVCIHIYWYAHTRTHPPTQSLAYLYTYREDRICYKKITTEAASYRGKAGGRGTFQSQNHSQVSFLDHSHIPVYNPCHKSLVHIDHRTVYLHSLVHKCKYLKHTQIS